MTLPAGSVPEPSPALAGVSRLREGGRERRGFVGLDRNERLGPLPDALIDEVRGAIDSGLLTTYPMLEDLYDELSAALDVSRDRLLLTPGSDGAVRALHQCFIRPGDRTVSLDPSYAMYPIYARMFGAQPVQVAFDEDLTIDADRLLEAIVPGVRLVLIAEPNQPTGTVLGADVLLAVLSRAARTGALVVIDEAYFPFSATTVLPLVREHPNLAVTRTFSKAWGLAGLRIGFAAAAPEIIATLYKVRTAYDVNGPAAEAARVMLRHPEVAQGYADEVAAGRRALAARTVALGLRPLDGATNFMLIDLEGRVDPGEIVRRLHDRKYLVKGPFTQPGLSSCIRVTLGPPALMERFADVLTEVLDA